MKRIEQALRWWKSGDPIEARPIPNRHLRALRRACMLQGFDGGDLAVDLNAKGYAAMAKLVVEDCRGDA